MSLEKWLKENRLSTHKTSKQEINNLLRIVARDIQDAQIEALSDDRRFITAYNAALQLATCILFASGYRTKSSKSGHHWVTFAVLPDIMGDVVNEYSNYFNTCRTKRNKGLRCQMQQSQNFTSVFERLQKNFVAFISFYS